MIARLKKKEIIRKFIRQSFSCFFNFVFILLFIIKVTYSVPVFRKYCCGVCLHVLTLLVDSLSAWLTSLCALAFYTSYLRFITRQNKINNFCTLPPGHTITGQWRAVSKPQCSSSQPALTRQAARSSVTSRSQPKAWFHCAMAAGVRPQTETQKTVWHYFWWVKCGIRCD